MEQLSTADAAFLYVETPETPGHTALLGIFQLPDDYAGNVYEEYKAYIGERLHLLSYLHRRLSSLPVTVLDPFWVDDENVDLDYHVRHQGLPRPGTMAQLRSLVVRLHTILLDRTRPLWQFHVIEGLEGNRFAIYCKVHHACVDGGANMASLGVIFEPAPPRRPVEPPARPIALRSQEPTLLELMGSAYERFLRQQLQMIESLPNIAKAMEHVGRRAAGELARPPRPLPRAPRTPLNVSVGRERSYGTSVLSLAATKRVAKAAGCKVNDVVMAVCAGALRRHLESRKALPPEPLVAAVPVSLRKPGDTRMNNQVTAFLSSLCTDVADPVARLRGIRDAAADAKAWIAAVKDTLPTDVSLFGAPLVMTSMVQFMSRTGAADRMQPVANVLISNVAGPQAPLYFDRARLEGLCPVSTLGHGMALNLTVVSYLDNMQFGIMGCKQAVPDAQRIADDIVEEFAVLEQGIHGDGAAEASAR